MDNPRAFSKPIFSEEELRQDKTLKYGEIDGEAGPPYTASST